MSAGVEGATSDEQEHDQPCDIWEAKVSRSQRAVLEARLASISISGRWQLVEEACVSVELALLQSCSRTCPNTTDNIWAPIRPFRKGGGQIREKESQLVKQKKKDRQRCVKAEKGDGNEQTHLEIDQKRIEVSE